MARHRANAENFIASLGRRYGFTISLFVFVAFVTVLLEVNERSGTQQFLAAAITGFPLLLSYAVLAPFQWVLPREAARKAAENIIRIFVTTAIAGVLALLITTARVPNAASGQGLLVAGFAALINWGLFIELAVTVVFDRVKQQEE